MSYLKKLVKGLVHKAGFDLLRLNPYSNSSFQLLKALNRFEVDLVFDVGANAGQFASGLLSLGYQKNIVSFEPLSVAHRDLQNTARKYQNWQVHARCAVGDRDGEVDFNISGNSESSSVLPMLHLHSSAAEGSGYVGTEKVPICRIDSVAKEYLALARRPFLKIDTQGFEWQVLDGARETLPKFQGVLCELSLIPLYDGQRLWMDLIRRLEIEGFVLWSIQRGFTDPRDGRTLQVDATFFRSAPFDN